MTALTVQLELRLDRFDLELDFAARALVTGIFGPSGAGKSSLLETLAGMRRQARGRIAFGAATWLDSERGIVLPPERRGIGYVPQDGLLFPHLDVQANLRAGRRRATRANAPGFDSVVDLLGLAPLLHRSPAMLSGGERQRVALGRALCSGPALLLLDEPLAALDLPLRRRLLLLMRRLRREFTVPMILVSHDPIEIQALCDEVLMLDSGRAVAFGPPHRVLSDARILPPTAGAGFANLLTGRVVGRGASSATVRLAAGAATTGPSGGVEGGGAGPEITVAPAAAGDDDVLLELPADRILIALERPPGLSARNALPAVVRRVDHGGGVAMVHTTLEPGGVGVVVEVTDSTPARLNLEAGRPVHLVFKATSCRLYGEGA